MFLFNKLLLHCIPISVAKPNFMLHLLHNFGYKFYGAACAALEMFYEPSLQSSQLKGRQRERVRARERERGPGRVSERSSRLSLALQVFPISVQD